MFWKKNRERVESVIGTERTQMYSEFLRKEGYAPQLDSDGDILFKMEGRTYLIIVDRDDEEFFRIVFPNFWSIENEKERRQVHEAALHATAQTKVAKVFPVRDDVWASVELFCSPPDSFKPVFRRSMSALAAAIATFVSKMRE